VKKILNLESEAKSVVFWLKKGSERARGFCFKEKLQEGSKENFLVEKCKDGARDIFG
jgi:hypothetical protein